MFWKKKSAAAEVPKPEAENLPGPRTIEELVGKHMVSDLKCDPDWVYQLKSVVRHKVNGAHRFDFRVFDDSRVKAKSLAIRNYTSFDNYPELILYQGWFDKGTMEVHFEEQKNIAAPVNVAATAATVSSPPPPESRDTVIFTEQEIWARITGLHEPGSTVFFYLAGSPATGGPLGRGVAIIELNPKYPGKNQKRYVLSVDDVVAGQHAGKKQRLFDSDSSKVVARWVKERHYQP